MENIKIKGIVLNAIDYKESSKIVYIYTSLGIISVRALGAKKQSRGILPFITTMNYCEAIITNSDFPKLIDYSLFDSFNNIKADLKKELWFSYMLEIISKIPKDAPHDKIFPLVLKIFSLGEDNINPMLLSIILKTKLLYAFGVSPILKKCVICNSVNPKYFSISKGGALCINCNDFKSYDEKILNQIKSIYYFDIYNGDISIFNDYDLNNLFKIIVNYYENHVNIYLKGLNTLIF